MNEVLNVVGMKVAAQGNLHNAQWSVGDGSTLIPFYEGITVRRTRRLRSGMG